MKRHVLFISVLCITLSLMGCAFGRKIPYENMKVTLTGSGIQPVALSVIDSREMVTGKNRKPDFVGYTRSGAGIAYPMGTGTGRSFAEIIQETMAASLINAGCDLVTVPLPAGTSKQDAQARLIGEHKNRAMVVILNKMHSDYYAGTIFYYDVDFHIYDNSGKLILLKNFQKDKNIGGSVWGTGKYKEYIPEYVADEMTSWLNDPEIKAALE